MEEILFKHGFGGIFFTRADLPRIRVVAILTAHRTALHKHNVAYPRPVHRTETFKRMNIAFHFSPRIFPIKYKRAIKKIAQTNDVLRYAASLR